MTDDPLSLETVAHILREAGFNRCADAVAAEIAERDALRARVAGLWISLNECASDLEAEIVHRYPDAGKRAYPSETRRYERDMGAIHRARAALSNRETGGEG